MHSRLKAPRGCSMASRVQVNDAGDLTRAPGAGLLKGDGSAGSPSWLRVGSVYVGKEAGGGLARTPQQEEAAGGRGNHLTHRLPWGG